MTNVAHARTTDPSTSHDAAAKVNVMPCREAIMQQAGWWSRPWTAEDMCLALPMYTDSNVRGRIAELRCQGLVVPAADMVRNQRGNLVTLYRGWAP